MARLLSQDRSALKRTIVYVFAQLLQRGANYLLLPFLVLFLSASDFTRYGLLSSAYVLIGMIFTLQIHLAPGRLFFDHEEPRAQADLLVTVLITSVFLNVIFCTLGVLLLQIFDVEDPVTVGAIQLQIMIAISIVTFKIMEFGTMVMRINGQATNYMIVAIVRQFGLLIGFVLIASLLIEDGFLAFVIALMLSVSVAAGIGIKVSLPALKHGRFVPGILKPALAFSLPVMLHSSFAWIIQNSGRWIGTSYLTLEELAPYNLVLQIVLVFAMFSRAMFEAQLPEIGRAFGQNKIKLGIRVINRTVLAGVAVIILLYTALGILLFVVKIDLPVEYLPTPALILFAMFGNLFDALYLRGIQINQALKRTRTQALSTFISGTFTILLSIVLVQSFADTGLILAFVIGMFTQAGLSNWLASRELRLELHTQFSDTSRTINGS